MHTKTHGMSASHTYPDPWRNIIPKWQEGSRMLCAVYTPISCVRLSERRRHLGGRVTQEMDGI